MESAATKSLSSPSPHASQAHPQRKVEPNCNLGARENEVAEAALVVAVNDPVRPCHDLADLADE